MKENSTTCPIDDVLKERCGEEYSKQFNIFYDRTMYPLIISLIAQFLFLASRCLDYTGLW